jgi:DnaJ domain.
MKAHIMRNQTPEEQELDKKLSELAKLETKLVQRELDLTTLQSELHPFEASYLRVVGVRLAELDEIKAQIAEAEARLKPKEKKIQEQAAQARAQAQESAQAAWISEEPREEKFKPPESLKKIYREVAKSIHPDLASDEKERLRRHKLMAAANRAYEEGNEDKLRAIFAEWESSPESVKGEGTAAELVRVIRKIAQAEKRLHAIKIEVTQLKKSDLYKLKTKAEKAEDEGRDLLAELASRIDEEIAANRNRLAKLTKKECTHE